MKFSEMTIGQVEQWMDQAEEEQIEHWLHSLSKDERAGIKKLVQRWQRYQEQKERSIARWKQLQQIEARKREEGYTTIVGVDEVGRGPLAGPVVAAAVILPADFVCLDLNDSKQLSSAMREKVYTAIVEQAVDYQVQMIAATDIDTLNIYQATKRAMEKCITTLTTKPDVALIDAMKLDLDIPQESLVKGDSRSASIAAASVVAKVHRDKWMKEVATNYEGYGFERNMGYGTQEHIQAIQNCGPTDIHRRSFLKNVSSE